MSFLEGMGTQGGKSLLLASLWVFLMMMIFASRVGGIAITPEGVASLAKTSDMLLGALIAVVIGVSK